MKWVLFYTLMEYGALVKEMLLMMSGDVESNPGPSEYLQCILLVECRAWWGSPDLAAIML